MSNRYVILSRNGYEFAAEGVEYAVYHNGKLMFLNMNKKRLEDFFMRVSK